MANVCFPSFGISRVGRKWLSIFEIWRNRDCSQSKRRQLKQCAGMALHIAYSGSMQDDRYIWTICGML